MNELKKLYAYLDGFTFVNDTEVYMAVQDFFSDGWKEELSYWEIALCNWMAEQYMNARNLDFDDDFDAREDENAYLDSLDDEDFEDIEWVIEWYLTYWL